MLLPIPLLSLCLPASAATTLLAPDADHDGYRVATTTTGDTVAGVKADVSSDAGSASVTLLESDAWLHGSASLGALPATTATVSLTLYDSGSALLQTHTGTLAADGTFTLDAGDAPGLDLEVLAAGTFADAAGYALTVDLRGADTYAVAYGALVVTETVTVTSCEKGGACTSVTSTRETEAELGWDAVGAVWEAELATAPEGVVEIKATSTDARGRKLEKTKVALALPWDDGGVGVGVVATDDDPLTRVGLSSRTRFSTWDTPMEVPLVAVFSDGWDSADSLPVDAELELASGAVEVIPVHSYQRTDLVTVRVDAPFERVAIQHRRGSETTGVEYTADGVASLAIDDLATPVCVDGVCVALADLDGEIAVSVTAYADDVGSIPDDLELGLRFLDSEGTEVEAASLYPHFQDDIKPLFVAASTLAGDPVGQQVVGKLKLRGEANAKGKQATLAKGKLFAAIGRDADGELAFAGLDKDLATSPSEVLGVGEALSLADDNGDGFLDGPPVLALETTGGPTVSGKHGDILIDGVPIDYD